MLTLLILYAAGGLFLVALSVPLWFQKVRPNVLYGFRLSPAFDSEETWYATNKYAAKWLAAAGIAIVLSALGLYFIPGMSVDCYALACLAAFVTVFGLGLFMSLRYARAVADEKRRSDPIG
jgi:uncharacterized membrane protein